MLRRDDIVSEQNTKSVHPLAGAYPCIKAATKYFLETAYLPVLPLGVPQMLCA